MLEVDKTARTLSAAELSERRPLTKRQRIAIESYARNVGRQHLPLMVQLVYECRDGGETDSQIEDRLDAVAFAPDEESAVEVIKQTYDV